MARLQHGEETERRGFVMTCRLGGGIALSPVVVIEIAALYSFG